MMIFAIGIFFLSHVVHISTKKVSPPLPPAIDFSLYIVIKFANNLQQPKA